MLMAELRARICSSGKAELSCTSVLTLTKCDRCFAGGVTHASHLAIARALRSICALLRSASAVSYSTVSNRIAAALRRVESTSTADRAPALSARAGVASLAPGEPCSVAANYLRLQRRSICSQRDAFSTHPRGAPCGWSPAHTTASASRALGAMRRLSHAAG